MAPALHGRRMLPTCLVDMPFAALPPFLLQLAALAGCAAPRGDHRHPGCGIPLFLRGPEPRSRELWLSEV